MFSSFLIPHSSSDHTAGRLGQFSSLSLLNSRAYTVFAIAYEEKHTPIIRSTMAAGRRKATTRGGKHSQPLPSTAYAGTGKRSGADYAALQAARQEAERREHLAADRRRADAKWLAKIPEVRKFSNFEAFKNRFHEVGDRDYAIEVLMAAPNLQAQIRREQAARRKEEMARNRQKWGLYYGPQGMLSRGLWPS